MIRSIKDIRQWQGIAGIFILLIILFSLDYFSDDKNFYKENAPYVFSMKERPSTKQNLVEVYYYPTFKGYRYHSNRMQSIKEKLSSLDLEYQEYNVKKQADAMVRLKKYLNEANHKNATGPVFVINGYLILYNHNVADQIAGAVER